MDLKQLKILSVLGLIASGFLAVFLVLTPSTELFHWDGSDHGNPTGETVVIPSNPLRTNKIHLVVGAYFIYSNQPHETGTFNLTKQGTGEVYSVSYEISAGTLVGMEYDGAILELPAGTYTITADNHHPDLTPSNQVEWQIIQAGYLRFSGFISGDIPDAAEGWIFTLLGIGAFILGLFSVIAIIKGNKSGGKTYKVKSKPVTLQGQPVKSFVESSPYYHTTAPATAPSVPITPAPLPSPEPALGDGSISSDELDLIAQAALKKAGPTKACPACGKILPANAKFCNVCGQEF